MTRPLYLADEVRARLAQYEVMMAALTRIADLCADGVVTLGQIEHLARKALAPSEADRGDDHA